jgi:hypothetical protein
MAAMQAAYVNATFFFITDAWSLNKTHQADPRAAQTSSSGPKHYFYTPAR